MRNILTITFILTFGLSFGQTIEISSYDFESKKENLITIAMSDSVGSIQPNFYENKKVDLKKMYSPLKFYNSDVSPLFRTRDLLGGVNTFPSSAVVKLVKFKNGEEVSTCTGTLISDNYLITAAHCLRTDYKDYPEKISILPMYDNGKNNMKVDSIFVIKSFVLKSYVNNDSDPNCSDIALYKINKNIGKELGHIGLNINKNPDATSPIYTFTYPHKSTSYHLNKVKSQHTDTIVIKELERLIEISDFTTPDFKNTNQYFKYGKIEIEPQSNSFKMKIPYVIPGESGGSWITDDYYFLGVNSKLQMASNEGIDAFNVTYCRNEKLLAAFLKIIQHEKGN